MARTLEERFWAKVQTGGLDECWPWLAGTVDGYGRIYIHGQSPGRAHRVAYELLVGPIPAGCDLDHTCNMRACCNPAHMTPRTRAQHTARHNPPKASCPQGHAYTPENTYFNRATGGRVCRACHLALQRQRKNPTGRPSNAAKTRCPRGHLYTPENTYVVKRADGRRERLCRTCTLERQAAQRASR